MNVKNISIDLSNATEDDLNSIKSEVMKRLTERAKTAGTADLYDRHGSGHSRSTPPSAQPTDP